MVCQISYYFAGNLLHITMFRETVEGTPPLRDPLEAECDPHVVTIVNALKISRTPWDLLVLNAFL